MKRIALTTVALAAVACITAPASAFDGYYRWMRHYNHARHHDDLDHRAFHRELRHREAHRYPMTYRQHDRFHDVLDHEAFHDSLEHRGAHRSRAYRPYHRSLHRSHHRHGSGIGIHTRRGSIWFRF